MQEKSDPGAMKMKMKQRSGHQEDHQKGGCFSSKMKQTKVTNHHQSSPQAPQPESCH